MNWIVIVDSIVVVLKTSRNKLLWNIIILLVHNIRIVGSSSIWIEHGSISKLAGILTRTNLIHLIDTPRRCVVVRVYNFIYSILFSFILITIVSTSISSFIIFNFNIVIILLQMWILNSLTLIILIWEPKCILILLFTVK